MIGFFDSGLGGLTILKEAVKVLPRYSYVYLSDNARTPYGSRSQETIHRFTLEGVRNLFEKGAKLIVLACNTSSSASLRRIQQEFLPRAFPDKKVLGIIIPTAEEVGKFSHSKEIGILATEATVDSLAYPKEINKVYPYLNVHQQACPLLVPIIEAGEINSKNLDAVIRNYLDELFVKSRKIDTIILGCTHYAIIENEFKRHLPKNIRIVSQGPIIANKLKNYLFRHPETEKKISKDGKRLFFSSGNSEKTESLAISFYGKPTGFKAIKI